MIRNFMKTYNGHDLKIIYDKEYIINELKKNMNDKEYLEYYEDEINAFEKKLSEKEIIENIQEGITRINNFLDPEHVNEIFELMAYKKNGTFNKKTKPTLCSFNHGVYLEDCYGWETYVIRIEPISDKEAKVVLSTIVEHY